MLVVHVIEEVHKRCNVPHSYVLIVPCRLCLGVEVPQHREVGRKTASGLNIGQLVKVHVDGTDCQVPTRSEDRCCLIEEWPSVHAKGTTLAGIEVDQGVSPLGYSLLECL